MTSKGLLILTPATFLASSLFPHPLTSLVSLCPPSFPRLGTYRNGPGSSGLARARRAGDENVGPLQSRAEERRSLSGGGHVGLGVSNHLSFGGV